MSANAPLAQASMNHLLSIGDLDSADIEAVFALASQFQTSNHWGKDLAQYTVAHLFLEPSTRTSASFEQAAKRLGANLMTLPPEQSSLLKGESLLDTAQTLINLGANALVVRHKNSGAPRLLAKQIDIPVLNAGDGCHAHPTQALLDAYTLSQRWGNDFSGKRVAIIGDILHGRVARSTMTLLKRLGAQVTLVGPQALVSQDWETVGYSVAHKLDVTQYDALIFLRVQHERQGSPLLTSKSDYRKVFGLTPERMQALPKDTLILHPGPVNFGVELDHSVLNHPNCLINQQVTHGLFIRMACLSLLLNS